MIETIPDYCREVNIPPPLYPFFDIRRFEDKSKTENQQQLPFRHPFYVVALRHEGENKQVNGQPLHANLFFNSPYQVVSWDVLPRWKGWYIMFGQDFLALNPAWKTFLFDFPFFRLDSSIPFDLVPEEVMLAENLFQQIWQEYHSGNKDKFLFIQPYTQLLLLLTKRRFDGLEMSDKTNSPKTTDVLLVSRFQALIETQVSGEGGNAAKRQPSFYAAQLHVHPNHLNAVVKKITGKTAMHLIQAHLLTYAKSLLLQTDLSAKEIAFRLHFAQPAHFNSFFKKWAGITPQQYRSRPRI